MAKNVHQLKEKLDNYRYRDRTRRVQLRPCIQQLDKYTHTHTHTHTHTGYHGVVLSLRITHTIQINLNKSVLVYGICF